MTSVHSGNASSISRQWEPQTNAREPAIVDVTGVQLTVLLHLHLLFPPSRVRTNLRVVVAMPQMGVAMPSGCAGWAELLNALKVCYHLPWDRKQLMNVAMHHLAGEGCGHMGVVTCHS